MTHADTRVTHCNVIFTAKMTGLEDNSKSFIIRILRHDCMKQTDKFSREFEGLLRANHQRGASEVLNFHENLNTWLVTRMPKWRYAINSR